NALSPQLLEIAFFLFRITTSAGEVDNAAPRCQHDTDFNYVNGRESSGDWCIPGSQCQQWRGQNIASVQDRSAVAVLARSAQKIDCYRPQGNQHRDPAKRAAEGNQRVVFTAE